jgi:hypothetical protein
MDDLLTYLSADVLPWSNCMPRTLRDCKNLVMKMGLEHAAIPYCTHGYILYEGEHAMLDACLTYNTGRYVPGTNNVELKMLRYFSIVRRLKRMYKTPKIAELMKWHADNHTRETKMQSVVDSQHWLDIDKRYGDFAAVKTNYRLGLVGDGVNPYAHQSSKHSMWPFLVVVYNLPLAADIFCGLDTSHTRGKGTDKGDN